MSTDEPTGEPLAILEQLAETNTLLRQLVERSDVSTAAAEHATAEIAKANRVNEAKNRTTRLGVGVMAIAVLIAGVLGYRWVDGRTISCAERVATSANIRGAIVVAVDEAAIVADVPAGRRDDFTGRVERRVLDEYPPPDC